MRGKLFHKATNGTQSILRNGRRLFLRSAAINWARRKGKITLKWNATSPCFSAANLLVSEIINKNSRLLLKPFKECPNSTSPLQEYLSLHFQDDCFNATAEEEGQIKAKILGKASKQTSFSILSLDNYGGCDQFNASLLEPCRSSSESAHLTMAPFFMLFFMLILFK